MNFFLKLFQKKSTVKTDINKSFDEIYSDLGMFEYLDDGFKIESKDFSRIIKWSDIDKINAYKKDLYTYDLVVMEIICEENALTINEESPGWFQLILKLKIIFETIPKDWEMNIIQPTFATNFTTIYNKM